MVDEREDGYYSTGRNLEEEDNRKHGVACYEQIERNLEADLKENNITRNLLQFPDLRDIAAVTNAQF